MPTDYSQREIIVSGEPNTSEIWDKVTVSEVLGSFLPFITVGFANADFVCDGVADNVEIQEALDYAASLGGAKVYFQAGTFNVISNMRIGSNTFLIGQGIDVTIFKMGSGLNKTIFNNSDTVNGNSFLNLQDLTLDQQGATQSAGGGMSFTGLTDSTFQNVSVNTSYNFNLFVGSLTGTYKTGIITLTNGQAVVTGVSTLFTSELEVGSIIKTAANRFARVISITSNTVLTLDRAWGFATESSVAYKLIPANARNKILNCIFNGTRHSDNVGLGLFDDSLILGNVSRDDAAGYGIGPDHTNNTRIIGNTFYGNSNAGIGLETCGNCVVTNNVSYQNSVGINLISGCYRNLVANNQCYSNTIGIQVSYNSTTFPTPDENQIINNDAFFNSTHGIRVGGCYKTTIANNRAFNNVTSGIVTVTDLTVAPLNTLIQGNQCYDNQDTKTQQKGIWISGGTSTLVIDNISRTADNLSAGITDAGTGTLIRQVFNTEGFSISNSAATNAIDITQTGDVGSTVSSDGAIHINNTAGNGIGLAAYSNNGAGATAPLVHFKADNAAFTQPVQYLENDGTGFGIRIAQAGTLASGMRSLEVRSSVAQTNGTTALLFLGHDSASSTQVLEYLLNQGTGDSIFLDKNNSGNGINIDQDANSASAATGLYIDVANAGAGAAYGLVVAAGNSGMGTVTPNAKAILDLTSTTQGFLPPRMTTTQRDAIVTPPAGLLIFNTSTNKLNVFTTAWEQVTSV